MSICARSRERRSLPRISGPGLERNSPQRPCVNSRRLIARRSAKEPLSALWRKWPNISETLRQFAGAAISHPAVLEGYFEGTMLQTLADNTRKYLAANIEGMSAEEAAVAAFLRFRLDKLAEQDRTKSAA